MPLNVKRTDSGFELCSHAELAYDVDVVVLGGGPAGVAAAFSAAILGQKVLLVEQFNCLGGVATAGGHGHICSYVAYGTQQRVVGGWAYEVAARVDAAGYGCHQVGKVDFEVEGMKLILEQMAEEQGVQLLYHSFFADCHCEDGRIQTVFIQNKDGIQAVRARQYIDCTGDGDVAARAGCSWKSGDEESGQCQPVTLMFTIGGVDYSKVAAFRGNDYALADVWEKAQKNGDMRPYQTKIMGWWWTPTRPDQLGINFTHVNYIDCTKSADLTKATLEARRQAYETIEVYRKYIPGMEQCYMISTPNTIGLRESRRILGDYYLTLPDIIEEKEFSDSIGYGCFFIDIHNCSGPGMDRKRRVPRIGFKYQIPYRILLPQGVNNLQVAGRCVSVDHEALGSLRVMPQCFVMGQAAGTAAALANRHGCDPRQVPFRELQQALKEQNCILDEEDVQRFNPEFSTLAAGGI